MSVISKRFSKGRLASHAIMLLACAAVLAPLLWVLSLSLQGPGAAFSFPPHFLPTPPILANYPAAWSAEPFGRMYINSIVVAGGIILGQLFTTAMGAYALTRIEFRGRRAVFMVILSTMMVPIQLTFIPAFLILSRLNWIDTYQALIVPFIASGFGIFLLRQSFMQVPMALIDAARMDGASHWAILRHVMVPLARPAIITLAVLNFVFHYNQFFWPLIVTNSNDMRTLPVGLASMVLSSGTGGTQWNQLMAADVFTLVPLIALFSLGQKYLTQTPMTAGVK